MKRLYTSYFARASKHPKAISISAKSPMGFKGNRLTTLAPTWDMLTSYKNNLLTKLQYIDHYIELIKLHHRPDEIFAQNIADLFQEGDVLLCYERTGSFCHRHIVAALLNEAGIAQVYELDENLIPYKTKIGFEQVVEMTYGDIQWPE